MPYTLARGWWRDPILSAYVHDQIRGCLERGMSDPAVAAVVGCTWRTVFRYRHDHGIEAIS